MQHVSSLPLSKVKPPIMNIVRLGLYQILFLSKIPPSAAVDESVQLAKKKAPRWVVGYVNGVLRGACRKAPEMLLPEEASDPIGAISVQESYPPWLVERWVHRIGLSETKDLCRSMNCIPPVTIRVNTLRASRQEVKQSLVEDVQEIRSCVFFPDCLRLKGMLQPIGKTAPFQKGWFQVQDEAAQIAGFLLNPKPGEKVLDACAGFGGKTGHLAQLMGDSGQITALDAQPVKLEALAQTMKRLGISSVKTWERDASTPFSGSLSGAFDRILLDAPCSGLGVIRRNPDVKWRKKSNGFPILADRQRRLLDAVAPLVKPGGVLVYCVCSLEPEEGDEVMTGFLKSHGEFAIDDAPSDFSGLLDRFREKSGIFRSLPHRHDMDGFFMARLRRIA
jgi:16S rRNA (cytosine967-C5)-methyltransferase